MRALARAGLLLALLATVVGTGHRVSAQDRAVEVGFSRDVNRYRWSHDVRWRQTWGPWQLQATNQFLSNAFLLSNDRLDFRDEDRFDWQLTRALRPSTEVVFMGLSNWFSQGRAFSQDVRGGLRLRPLSTLQVQPTAGIAWDRRPGARRTDPTATPPLRTDVGPAAGLVAQFTPAPTDQYQAFFQGEALVRFITPRRGRALRLGGQAQGQFQDTQLRAQLNAASVRRDAYQSASFLNRGSAPTEALAEERIEATTSDTLQLAVELETPLYRAVRLQSRLNLDATNRFIRTFRAPASALFFNTDFRRRSFDSDVSLVLERPRLSVRTGLQLGANVERRELANSDDLPPAQAAQNSNLLEQADYDQGALAVHARFEVRPSARFTVRAEGLASLLRHDTPDTNPDDRDEAFQTLQVGLAWTLRPPLTLQLDAFGSSYHTVYLRAARSAENNVRRSVRIRPSLTWQPRPTTQFRFGTEVRATYTVDDFVLPGRRPSDQSAREMRYAVGWDQTLYPGVQLRTEGTYSDLRLARLLWDQFAEIPFDTLRTYSGWVRLQTTGRVNAEIGLRAFIRSDFDRAASVRYTPVDEAGTPVRDEEGLPVQQRISRPGRVWIAQLGPTARLEWPMPGGAAVLVDGWLVVQRIRQRLYGDLPELNAARIRRAARRGTRRVIPNLSLSLAWQF